MREIIQKIKILVIDDDRDICENLVKIFSYEGYIVKCSFNGINALKMISSENFNIIILDLKMPKIDGEEVLKNIAKLNKDIGIIILTGYPSVESAVNTLKNQAMDYITKPFKNDDLIKVVKSVIKKMGLIEDPQSRLNVHVGNNIKKYRIQNNYTIRDLAGFTKLSIGLISQIENGKSAASLLTLYRISQILNINLSSLVEGI
ncbi:response regulator [Candidatus Poribacteria bacterium]|nr:response regulator [Candidatus Poribacteria bacterium]